MDRITMLGRVFSEALPKSRTRHLDSVPKLSSDYFREAEILFNLA